MASATGVGSVTVALQARAQVFAGHVRHDEKQEAAGLVRVQQRHDPRVPQTGQDLDLTVEPLRPEPGGELRGGAP